MDRKQVGALGEKLAAGYLKKRGYKIIERNYHCRDISDRHMGQKVAGFALKEIPAGGASFGIVEISLKHSTRIAYRAA